ncbi:hypothetical protein [Paraburkholderia sp. JPY419]|uniref:hypothetical protein n=1 Tax=Paraburkholderia sp. JPY419 TaxID=667660 RepID=UPI003D22FAF8
MRTLQPLKLLSRIKARGVSLLTFVGVCATAAIVAACGGGSGGGTLTYTPLAAVQRGRRLLEARFNRYHRHRWRR